MSFSLLTAPMQPLTLKRIFEDTHEELGLQWLAGSEHGDKSLNPEAFATQAVSDMVGHLNLIHKDRLQIIGKPEYQYLSHLAATRQQHYLAELLAGNPPAVVIADGVEPPAILQQVCAAHGTPVFATAMPAARVIDALRVYLNKVLAEKTTMHGVLMDVLGLGVLITGESGLGKSELGLELISRAHGLVADDVVELTRVGPRTLEGRCPPLLKNLLEVRGLGLLDIKAIFGETAIRPKMRLKLIVHLERPQSTRTADYERLPLNANYEEVLGVRIRKVTIPVAAGRNLAVLTEAAVRNTILHLRGIDTMGEFMQRQQAAMDDGV
jgi:HPr kinase/phosphorylase